MINRRLRELRRRWCNRSFNKKITLCKKVVKSDKIFSHLFASVVEVVQFFLDFFFGIHIGLAWVCDGKGYKRSGNVPGTAQGIVAGELRHVRKDTKKKLERKKKDGVAFFRTVGRYKRLSVLWADYTGSRVQGWGYWLILTNAGLEKRPGIPCKKLCMHKITRVSGRVVESSCLIKVFS
jgi:hypothetical protein